MTETRLHPDDFVESSKYEIEFENLGITRVIECMFLGMHTNQRRLYMRFVKPRTGTTFSVWYGKIRRIRELDNF